MANAEYLVSVVTPFHNTRLHLFEKCVESLKSQTIGFGNIEWVVVLHNSEEEYVDGGVLDSIVNGYYAASEAMIGRSMGAGTDEYALLTDNAFFEFLEPGAGEPVMAADVEPGKCYELILTNAAGLYRYRLGDTVRVTRIESGVPIFTYGYRLDETIEIDEVAITEDVLEAVVPAVENASGADARPRAANTPALPRPHDVHGTRRPRPDQAGAHARHRGQAPLLHDLEHVRLTLTHSTLRKG